MSTKDSDTQERIGRETDQDQEGDSDSDGEAIALDVDVEEPPGEPELDEYYWKLRNYVRMVTSGETDALLIEAGPGIGKSYQITNVLQREAPHRYAKAGGKVTPLALYHKLFDVSDGGILFADDVEGILGNDTCVSLLKQATWSEGDQRIVEWDSTSDKLDAPEQFEFTGSIIFCVNETPDNILFDSLRTRCMTYDLSFTYTERMDIMREIAKVPYKDLSYADRVEVVEWIRMKTGPGDDVNLRTMFHIFDIRNFERERWPEMAVDQLENHELQYIRELLAEHETVKAAFDAFHEETDQSRSTFFRRKREIDADRGE